MPPEPAARQVGPLGYQRAASQRLVRSAAMTWPIMARGLFWLALVFTLVMALLPQPPALPGTPSDKTLHMMAFAVLSLLAALAYPQRRLGRIFITMAVLGALIEALQLIPALGRDAEYVDWLADCAASLAVLALIGVARRLAG